MGGQLPGWLAAEDNFLCAHFKMSDVSLEAMRIEEMRFFSQSSFLLPFVFVSIGRSVRDDFLVVGGHLLDLSEEGYK